MCDETDIISWNSDRYPIHQLPLIWSEKDKFCALPKTQIPIRDTHLHCTI